MSQSTPKNMQQILDEMIGVYGGTTGGTSSGGLTIGSASSGPGITLAQLMGHTPLTAEEKKELDELKSNHNREVKAARIAEFKKLPSELRQFVINFLVWQNEVNKINSVSVEKSPRLVELENKNSNPFSSSITLDGSIYYGGMMTITLPKDVDSDELKNAHAEATIEEQMLNPDPNGNTSDVVE